MHQTRPILLKCSTLLGWIAMSCALRSEALPPSLDPAIRGPEIASQIHGVYDKPGQLLLGNGDLGIVTEGTPGNWKVGIGKSDFWGVMRGSITTVGCLTISSHQLENASCHMEQNIGPATLTGSFSATNGASLQSLHWVDKEDNLLVIQLTNNGLIPLDFTGALHPSMGNAIPRNIGSGADSTWLETGADITDWWIGNRQVWGTNRPFIGLLTGATIYDQALPPDRLNQQGNPTPFFRWDPQQPGTLHGKSIMVSDPIHGTVLSCTDAGSQGLTQGAAQLPERSFTLNTWIRPDAHMSDGTIFAAITVEKPGQHQYPFLRGLLLQVLNGKLAARLNSEQIIASEPLPLNKWVEVTVTYGNGKLSLYAGSLLLGSVTMPSADDVMGWDKTAIALGDPKLPFHGCAPVAMMRQRVIGPAVTVKDQSLSFTLAPGQKATWLMAVVSDRNTADFRATTERLVSMDNAAVEARWKSHQMAWKTFWSKSFVEIPDKVIQANWYGSLYLLACCSRPECPPPGLWYNFVTTIGPRWDGDYTLDYNFQAPFWAAFAANHFALADNYDPLLLAHIPRGKALAKNAWRVDPKQQPGNLESMLAARHAIPPADAASYRGIYLYTHLIPLPGWSNDYGTMWNQKSNALFCAVNMIQRWRLTRDQEYARKVYPFLREVADFWESYLVLKDGHYQSLDDSVCEGSGSGKDVNPATTLSFLRLLYPSLIEISELLGKDEEKRSVWNDTLSKLSPFTIVPATSIRQLNLLGPDYTTGKNVIRDSEIGTEFSRPAVSVYKTERKERSSSAGMNSTQTVFPGWTFGLESSPEELEAAKNTVFLAAEWWDFNNSCTFYPAAAAVGHDPKEILENLRIFIDGTQTPNFMIKTSGGGTEDVAIVPTALWMMFLQSYQENIHLFPNWPREMDASFGQLPACGGFLISSSLREGKIEQVVIQSNAGTTCRLVNPWSGQTVEVTSSMNTSHLLEGDILKIPTRRGEVLILTPSKATH